MHTDDLQNQRAQIARGESRAPVPLPIAASWARCASRGLAVDGLDVPHAGDVDNDSALVRSAQPVLVALERLLVAEPVSILLSDAAGAVLDRRCHDRTILTALDRVALAPGSVYSEEAVGTNGFGVALADNRTALVRGNEHYSLSLTGYTCAGAPIHDPTSGAIVGALSLTTWSQRRSDLLVALADQTAMTIETRLGHLTGAGVPEGCAHVGPHAPAAPRPVVSRRPLSRIEQIEVDAVVAALERHHGSVGQAAADLGVSRATMYRKIKRYRIRLRSQGIRPCGEDWVNPR